jgi:hypothetical protein
LQRTNNTTHTSASKTSLCGGCPQAFSQALLGVHHSGGYVLHAFTADFFNYFARRFFHSTYNGSSNTTKLAFFPSKRTLHSLCTGQALGQQGNNRTRSTSGSGFVYGFLCGLFRGHTLGYQRIVYLLVRTNAYACTLLYCSSTY